MRSDPASEKSIRAGEYSSTLSRHSRACSWEVLVCTWLSCIIREKLSNLTTILCTVQRPTNLRFTITVNLRTVLFDPLADGLRTIELPRRRRISNMPPVTIVYVFPFSSLHPTAPQDEQKESSARLKEGDFPYSYCCFSCI